MKVAFFLILITYNYNTGAELQKVTERLTPMTMQDCLSLGTKMALRMTAEWKAKGYNNASTNVQCKDEPQD